MACRAPMKGSWAMVGVRITRHLPEIITFLTPTGMLIIEACWSLSPTYSKSKSKIILSSPSFLLCVLRLLILGFIDPNLILVNLNAFFPKFRAERALSAAGATFSFRTFEPISAILGDNWPRRVGNQEDVDGILV